MRDGMVTAAAGVRRSAWALEASGFSRVRPIGTQPANVDPALGARAAAETGFRAFAGDLGVTLRIETAWVGAREHESFPGYFSPPRPLAGYATYGASAAFTLGDARIVVRAANLEDEPHPQIWTDPSSRFPGEQRVFHRFSDLTNEIIEARIWAGIHFRNADVQAANQGREVVDYVHTHQFAFVH